MSEKSVKEFNDSMLRCLSRGDFLGTFYERLLTASDKVAALFDGVDMEHHQRLLKASLFICATANYDHEPGEQYLQELGRRHRDYGVDVDSFELWLSTLTNVVAEYDPRCSLDTIAAWETVMRRGIELMKEGHSQDGGTVEEQ